MKIAYSIPARDYDTVVREVESAPTDVEIVLYNLTQDAGDFRRLPKDKIISFHGPGTPLRQEFFKDHSMAASIAKDLEVPFMILHPHRVKDLSKRSAAQKAALQHIRDLISRTGIKIVIETFGSPTRVLRPEEIMTERRLMDLDTSHLSAIDVQYYMTAYASGITTIHLSERHGEAQHLPIGPYGESIAEELIKSRWNGILCCEYQPELLEEARRDANYLDDVVNGFKKHTSNDFDTAHERFTKAAETKPVGYLAQYGLGITKFRMRSYAGALENLGKALRLNPGHTDTLFFLAMTNYALGDTDTADDFRRQCVHTNSTYESHFTNIQ